MESGQLWGLVRVRELGRLGELVQGENSSRPGESRRDNDSRQTGESGQAEVGGCPSVEGHPPQTPFQKRAQSQSTSYQRRAGRHSTCQTGGWGRLGVRANQPYTPVGPPRMSGGKPKRVQTLSMLDRFWDGG